MYVCIKAVYYYHYYHFYSVKELGFLNHNYKFYK